MAEEDRWKKLEDIVRRVIREELSTSIPQQRHAKIGFEDGEFTGLDEKYIRKLRECFPAVDIDRQLREMKSHLMLNSENRPRSNYGAYIHKWLTKHQNAASLRSIPGSKSDPGPGKKLCAYCEQVATGMVSGTWHCQSHSRDAFDGVPVPRMRGVPQKAVAGE